MTLQRWFRGYSDDDIWNLDHTIISFIGPRVKALRKIVHGYPPSDEVNSFEKWLQILDDITFACDMFEEHDEFVTIRDLETYRRHVKVLKDYLGDDYSPRPYEDYERANKGLEYLKKYLLCLWD